MNDLEYSMVMPFLDASDSFAHGYECGMIYAEMKSGQPLSKRLAHITNEKQIGMIARLSGYQLSNVEHLDDTWFLFDATLDLTKQN